MLQSETVRKYDTYKDSGIEWIGKIPHEWNLLPHKYIMSKVKNICEKYDGEDIISLTMKGVIKRDLDNPMGKMPLTFDGYQRIETGNLLLCLFDIDVTPRCVGLIKDDGLTSPAYSQFKFLGQDCPQYYTYLLTMIDDDKCFLHLAKNLRSSLTEDNFGAILTIQPPLEEQQQIADYLDKKCGEIDRVIETEKLVIEKLKEYKQSIITEAVTKGLDKSVPLKDSGIEWIGKIPQHWEVWKLSRLSKQIIDGTHSTPTYTQEGIPFLRVTDISALQNINDDIDFENVMYIPINEHEELVKRCKPEKGDLLVSKNGSIGIPKIINWDSPFSIFVSLCLIKVTSKVLVEYLYYYFRSTLIWTEIAIGGKTGTITNLHLDKIKEFRIPLPNINEQKSIIEYLDKKCSEIDKAIADKEQVIEKFTEYKKSLIYECVTGKKRVA